MVLQYNLARVVDSRAHRGKLNEHVAAVLAVFNHALDLFKVAYRACKTVYDRFGVLVSVGVVVAVRMFNYGSVLKYMLMDGVVCFFFHNNPRRKLIGLFY